MVFVMSERAIFFIFPDERAQPSHYYYYYYSSYLFPDLQAQYGNYATLLAER